MISAAALELKRCVKDQREKKITREEIGSVLLKSGVDGANTRRITEKNISDLDHELIHLDEMFQFGNVCTYVLSSSETISFLLVVVKAGSAFENLKRCRR